MRARQLATQQRPEAVSYEYSDEEEETENLPPVNYQRQTSNIQQRQFNQQPQHTQASQQNKKVLTKKQRQQLEDEIEEEEPDQLAILLGKSQFSCNDRTTGYYADDSVGCQIFHYCADNTKVKITWMINDCNTKTWTTMLNNFWKLAKILKC